METGGGRELTDNNNSLINREVTVGVKSNEPLINYGVTTVKKKSSLINREITGLLINSIITV